VQFRASRDLRHDRRVRRVRAWPAALLLAVAQAADARAADEPSAPAPHAVAAAAPDVPAHPFDRGALGVEFTLGWLGEAWNLNDGREWLLDGTAAVWWSFADRLMLVTAFHAARVSQGTPRPAFVNGFSPQLRYALRRSERWTLFVELGPGISWSDTTVPPRGTRFNYLLLAGSGVSRRLTRQCHALAAFRWLHISNNGREGRGRNPDIEALGGYGGLAVVF